MADFIHLHTHSDYSLLDGAASIDSLTEKASQMGMNALALTDHGNMFGALKFYKSCREKGIAPRLLSLIPGSLPPIHSIQ